MLCGQLGGFYTNTSEIVNGEPGSGPIFIERLECSQTDTGILDCPRFSPLGLVNCNHSLDVSIRCQGTYVTLVLIYVCKKSMRNTCRHQRMY